MYLQKIGGCWEKHSEESFFSKERKTNLAGQENAHPWRAMVARKTGFWGLLLDNQGSAQDLWEGLSYPHHQASVGGGGTEGMLGTVVGIWQLECACIFKIFCKLFMNLVCIIVTIYQCCNAAFWLTLYQGYIPCVQVDVYVPHSLQWLHSIPCTDVLEFIQLILFLCKWLLPIFKF